MISHRIVAEITNNWPKPEGFSTAELTSVKFEQIIEANRQRGYVLESWQFNSTYIRVDAACIATETIIETIIAVFVEVR